MAETFIDKKGRTHHKGRWVHVVHMYAKMSDDGTVQYLSGAAKGDNRIRWVCKPSGYKRSRENGQPCKVFELGYYENLERNPYDEEPETRHVRREP